MWSTRVTQEIAQEISVKDRALNPTQYSLHFSSIYDRSASVHLPTRRKARCNSQYRWLGMELFVASLVAKVTNVLLNTSRTRHQSALPHMKRGTTHLKRLPARTEQRKDRLLLLEDAKCDSILHDPLLEVDVTISVRIGERDRWVDSEWTGNL